ncbi:MAG: hypothetical protein WBA76_10415 [Phormidesmis sp.]
MRQERTGKAQTIRLRLKPPNLSAYQFNLTKKRDRTRSHSRKPYCQR